MPSKEQVFAKVKAVIVDQLGVEEGEVSTDSTFVDDLGADSLDIVELIMAIEEEVQIEVPDQDVESLTTVGNVVEYVLSKS